MLDEQPAQNAEETYINRRRSPYARKNVVTAMAVVLTTLGRNTNGGGEALQPHLLIHVHSDFLPDFDEVLPEWFIHNNACLESSFSLLPFSLEG